MEHAWIAQKADYAEACLGCEFENEYTIYDTKVSGKSLYEDGKEKVFKCKEHSACCQRNCLPASMREFTVNLDINECRYDYKSQCFRSSWKPFLHIKRDYACTCLCCNRPVIEVSRVDKRDKEVLGYVRDEWACCDYVFSLQKSLEESPAYTVRANCCQCGLFCACPCGPCEKVTFDIIDNKNNAVVGGIYKVWSGCAREVITNADSYSVKFPKDMTADYKAILLACVLFIDYRYFEEKSSDKHHSAR